MLDRAISKAKQLLIILLQCFLTVGLLFLLVLVDPFLDDRVVLVTVNLNSQLVHFYLVSFVVGPLVTVLLLFVFSFWSSAREQNREVIIDEETNLPSFLGPDLIAKPKNKSTGKEMRFRQSSTSLLSDDADENRSMIMLHEKDPTDDPSQPKQKCESSENILSSNNNCHTATKMKPEMHNN